ncbi:MAG: hypothetical protein ACFFBC_05675 [Promethearchaeota archaeon]
MAKKGILIILAITYAESTIVFNNISFIARNGDKDIGNLEFSKILSELGY